MPKVCKNSGVFILAILFCLGTTINCFAATNKLPGLTVNGKKIEATATIVEGDLFIPLRVVSESLGYKVDWSEAAQKITMSRPGSQIILNLKESTALVNEHEFYITPSIKKGRTYVPAGFFTDNLGLQVKWDKALDSVNLMSVRENQITIKTVKEVVETPTLTLKIQYPQFEGLNNPEIQQLFNDKISKLALSAKEQGLENERELLNDPLASHRKACASVYFNYVIKYNQHDILSVVFDDYQYSGGAHGLTARNSYTFNLRTGMAYQLKDIFNQDDYISLINQEIKRQIQEQEMTLLYPFNGIKADQNFYLTSNSVVIYFQQYEYFPYAFGIPEFMLANPQSPGQ